MTTREAAELPGALWGSKPRDHFGSDAFDVRQIVATVWHDQNTVNLNLNLAGQQRVVMIDGKGFVQIGNARGRREWPRVNLDFVEPEQFDRSPEMRAGTFGKEATKKDNGQTMSADTRRDVDLRQGRRRAV